MKRILCLLFAICMLLPCLVACGSGQDDTETPADTPIKFESEEAMCKYLEGVWSFNDEGKEVFYAFRDGVLYCTDDEVFQNKVKEYIDSLMNDGGGKFLSGLEYQIFLDTYSVLTSLGKATMVAEEGTVYLYKGKKNEKRMKFFEDKALIKESYVSYDVEMKKISDTGDLSSDFFYDRYKEILGGISLTPGDFVSTEKYKDEMMILYPEMRWWEAYSQSETTSWYTSNGKKNGNESYLISKDTFMFSQGRGFDGKYQLVVIYNPETEGITLTITNKVGGSLRESLEYANPVLSVYPGALSADALYDVFETEKKISSGVYCCTPTINGIKYGLNENDEWSYIAITLPKKIVLSDCLDDMQSGGIIIPDETEPETTAPPETEPETTVPPETEPTKPPIVPIEELKANSNSKWKITFVDETAKTFDWDGTYEIYYALTEDGKCYVLMTAYTNWIFENGVGTYTVKGNRLSVTLNGKTVVYDVDVNNQTCTLVSDNGHIPCQYRGDVYSITSDTKLTMEDIIAKAQINLDEDY